MINLVVTGLGLLFLMGALCAFSRLKRWTVAIQILGAAIMLAGGIMGVLGPGDVILDLPEGSAEKHMRYIEFVGKLSVGGWIVFAVGYFLSEFIAYKRVKAAQNKLSEKPLP